MELLLLLAAAWVAALTPVRADRIQKPLVTRPPLQDSQRTAKAPKLTGRFLHITDIHPDPYYKVYSSTKQGYACHRGSGPAGIYGAETSDCDSPLALVNATFQWLDDNLKDQVDFVIWTGDSARHDNDERIPRNEKQVLGQNRMLVDKIRQVFGVKGHDEPRNPRAQPKLRVPVVPSFGNNDILPHNIFEKGPNHWTKTFETVWRPFIPEEQRHGFDRGGWFYVEVIPGKLAVFSLNTMYFFQSNSAVDGCGSHKEPGFEHLEWLRIQLQFLRERGIKAIMSGHVPPSRNGEKVGWDETCWQKYALWMQQYRDVVVGSMYGHMNIEHFVLQDFRDIDLKLATLGGYEMEGMTGEDGSSPFTSSIPTKKTAADEINVMVNAPDYLNALRELWSKLPSPPSSSSTDPSTEDLAASNEKEYHDIIGGEWAERFSLSLITASVVPNFFSAIRVYEYNISGLEDAAPWHADYIQPPPAPWSSSYFEAQDTADADAYEGEERRGFLDVLTKKKKKHKKPKFTVPAPPSPSAPPGPAYSPQPLALTGYTQYIANNTWINHDLPSAAGTGAGVDESTPPHPRPRPRADDPISTHGWNDGKHADERPGDDKSRPPPRPRPFEFEKEYDTRDAGDAYGLYGGDGLVMRRWVELASRIGAFDPRLDDGVLREEEEDEGEEGEEEGRDGGYKRDTTSVSNFKEWEDDDDAQKQMDLNMHERIHNHNHKHENEHKNEHEDKHTRTLTSANTKKDPAKQKRNREIVRTWYAFVSRAVTRTLNPAELRDQFG